ncbi:MAG: carboxypeptidase-like regulatory domain-containing protein [Flavobacteriales bacterium]|nr:carboxypeptidase-like regulatory domain-containing protein [Flavobacteriales bacterium]MCB9197959.1 carboxypeptidase-like regulatory domain-containing protein [Flavobacteriales bacterium]
MTTKIISAFALTLIFISTFSQKAIIRGQVTDKTNGETLPFANIYVKGDVSKGTTSDLDGNYTLKLDAGTYTIVYSFTSYANIEKDFTVEAGKTYVENVQLGTSNEVLGEVKVVAEKKTSNTMAAFDREKMKATNMVDGTSSEQMKKTGDGDAGEVIKRVTGVSVEGGKHVYVRGLGDRYTKTILNNMEIPGLDPDRNTVQMDIFPTNLIDNITVYKTFTPNLPGDYTGGLVNILTKDFPSQKTLTFTVGFGYNTFATFNPNFILYPKGKMDFLGFDDGGRLMPVSPNVNFPDPSLKEEELTTLTKKFNPQMAVANSSAMMNQTYSFGIGNQFNSEKKDLDYGYNFYVNYQNNYTFYEGVKYNAYRKDPDTTQVELFPDRKSSGQMGQQNVLWSALLSQSIKINKLHKISFNLFHTQNGQSQAASLTEQNFETNPGTLVKQSLQYTQRSVSNLNLSGKHTLKKNKWNANWYFAPSYSTIKDPDIRSTILEREGSPENGVPYTYSLNQSVGSEIRRIYRDLSEYNINSKVDFEYSFKKKDSLESKIMFGVLETYKARSFRVYDFVFNVKGSSTMDQFDPNYFFLDENIWTPNSNTGTYGDGEREKANSFDATQTILAAYAMNELPVTEKFKAVYGVRMEKVVNKYTGQNNSGTIIFNDSTVLDNLNFLPALNLVYVLKDSAGSTMNLRGSYTQTLARPSFREKSIAQIYDPIQGRRYNGNIDLLQTTIHNMDLRWEYFYGRTEVLSVSAFYKKFYNPIEIVSFDVAPNEVKPTNAGEADVYGIELEVRKRLGWIEKDYNKFYVGANFTYVKSQIDMNKVFINKGTTLVSEKEIRQANAREGEVIGDYRPMFGQSPYLVNAFISFTQDSLGIDANLSYNVQGKRLAVIGIGSIPDVYEQPFHSLNFKISKAFGPSKQWKASLTAQNILNFARRRYYEAYNAEPQIYDYFMEGRTFSLQLNYILK